MKRPVALPLKHHGERGDWLRTGLNDALHGVVMGKLADIAAAVLDHVDFIVVVNRLDGGQRDASLVQRPDSTIFLRPVFSIAATNFGSSQEFIEVRSIGSCFGKTACI